MTFVYLIPILLAVVWSIQYDRQEEFDAHKSHRFWLLCIILSLITGFSYALGGDKQQYLSFFETYSRDWSDLGQEILVGFMSRGQMPGWVCLNMFAKVCFDSFYPVQLIEAFFINTAVFYTCKRYTQRVFFFVLLYCLSFQYFNYNTEVMREAFAIGFSLFGIEAMFRRKYVLMFLLFIMALMFHASAVVMLLFPFMRFRITFRRFLLVCLAALFVWFVSNAIFKIFISLLLGEEGAFVKKLLSYASFSTGIIAFVIYAVIYLVAPFVFLRCGMAKGVQDEEIIRRKEYFLSFYFCLATLVPSFLILARFFNYPMVMLLCLTADVLFTLFDEKKHFIPKVACLFLFWGYSIKQYVVSAPKIDARCIDFWFPYTCIIDESYDRNRRDAMHEILVDGDKADENTRDVEL